MKDQEQNALLGKRLREDFERMDKRLDQASYEMGKSVAYFSLVTQGKRAPKREFLEEVIAHYDLDIRRYWRWVSPSFLVERLLLVKDRIPATDPFWSESGLNALSVAPEMKVDEAHVNFVTGLKEEQVRSFESEDYFILVPLVEGDIACGPPSEVNDHPRGYQPIYHTVLRKNVGPFSCVRADGKSMSPMIEEGSLCMIDHGQRDPERLKGKVVALNVDDGCTIKRLKISGDGRFLIGDPVNPAFDPVTIDLSFQEDHNPIIGKVIWSDRVY